MNTDRGHSNCIRAWAGAVLVGAAMLATGTTAHGQEATGLGRIGWTVLHRAAEEGDVRKLDALIYGGHDVEERISAPEEVARLRTIVEVLDDGLIEMIPEWMPRPILDAMRRVLEAEGKETPEEKHARKEAQSRRNRDFAERIVEATVARMNLVKAMMFEGATALHIAAALGHQDVVRFLLKEGASPETETQMGLRAIDFAALGNQAGMIELLVRNGSRTQTQAGASGASALHWAAFGNAVQSGRELLRRGARVNAKTHDGATPMDFSLAHEAKGYLFQELLRQHGGRCASNCPAAS